MKLARYRFLLLLPEKKRPVLSNKENVNIHIKILRIFLTLVCCTFFFTLRDRIRWDKSHTNSMHFVFYPTRRDEKQEKEEQKTPCADHLLGIS